MKQGLTTLHWVIVIFSMGLTLVAWKFSKDQVDEKFKQQFEREANQVVALVRERMEKYEDGLWGGVSVIHTHEEKIEYNEWLNFSNSLKIDNKYPGINGIGVIHFIPENGLNKYLKEQRKIRPHFQIHPEHDQHEFWPITFIEPVKENTKAVGLDIAHEENRYTAAKKARDSGRAMITGPIILVQDQEQTPGFLFYAPFYKGGEYKTIKERRNNFIGMVYAPFVMKNLLNGTLNKNNRHVGIRISDDHTILYDEHNPEYEDYDPNPSFIKNKTLNLYGRKWSFDIRSAYSFKAATENNQPEIILFAGIIIDILLLFVFILLSDSRNSALKYAEKMHDEADAQRALAINSAKLASLGEMAGGVAHEINNPLTILKGKARKIRRLVESGDRASLEAMMLKMDETIDRIVKIVNGMRNVARDGSRDEKEDVLVFQILDDALSICTENFKKSGIDVIVNDYGKDLKMFCRRVEFSQVLINLLNNAFHAIKNSKNPWIKIKIEKRKDVFLFKITDSGLGIAPEIRDKILQPFFTTKKVGEGTGLGLSISKLIIESHGGILRYDEKSANTSFIIELPIESDVGLKRAA